MTRDWTFARKISAGFAVPVGLTLAMSVASLYAMRAVVETKDHVIRLHDEVLDDTRALELAIQAKGEALRAFLLLRDDRHLDDLVRARGEFTAAIARLRPNAEDEEDARQLDALAATEQSHERAMQHVVTLRRSSALLESVIADFEAQVLPIRERLSAQVATFASRQNERSVEESRASDATTSGLSWLVSLLAAGTFLGSTAAAFALVRGINAQIGSAVGHVQSSAAELQGAANQQLTATREQATAMTQMTTTISELLVAARQIAESAQRVAQMSHQSAAAAERGGRTVDHGKEAMAAIRRQVDSIVAQMLELGRKSQEVESVLDIVSELADQTNILSINATIEAAGAGESGERFAVVADEIRKLADRVASSTKEIRSLIDDVRGSVNATIATTETGSKAVDVGSRELSEVAAAFTRIAELVVTTTEASREIELSTQQQTSAVEQVDAGISSVALAARETEASSGQTLQTASQLAQLSRELVRMMRVDAPR
jgi:methyl-accepting chemotaxis protein